MTVDHFRDEVDRSRYELEAWRTRPVYASPEHILAVGKAMVEARAYRAAEAAVGYSLA